jgi:class 3 adenylate cyclase
VGELPSGTVTFLFTDLEGSTRLWQEHPEAMKSALARHDELVRAAVEDHDAPMFVKDVFWWSSRVRSARQG